MAGNNNVNDLINKINDLIETIKNKETQSSRGVEKDKTPNEYNKIIREIDSYGKTKEELLEAQFQHELEILKENLGDTEEFLKKKKELEHKYYLEEIKLQDEKGKKNIEEKKRLFSEELELMQANGASAMQILNARIEQERELHEEGSKELLLAEAKYNKSMREARMSAVNNLISAVQNIINAAQQRLDDVMNSWGKVDQAAHTYGRSVGLTADKMDKLRTNTLDFLSGMNGIARQYNINSEELIALQGGYLKGLGRAVALNETNLKNMIAMRNVMGETESIKFSTSLEKFGIDIDAAGEMMSEMYTEAGNRGIVFSEMSEAFLNNIELAQQYTFKDGVEGLKRMAEQAVAVKWNMQQTAAFAEKVNNIEGAVTTGAQLSVLGGSFAQFSNPMGMLYESLNDMEGLQDRMITMFKDLGSWNDETGQFEVSAFNRQRIRAASSAMGLNYGEVMNNVYSSARREKIKDSISYLGLDENTMELIMNTGQIDKNGQVYVNITDEKTGAVKRKDITSEGLTEEEVSVLKKDANNEAQDIKDIAKATMSTSETVEGIKKEVETNKAYVYDLTKPGGWVPGLAATVAYSTEVLNQINMILSVITSVVTAIAATNALKGFGGASGKISSGGVFGASGKATNAGGKVVNAGGNVAKSRGLSSGAKAGLASGALMLANMGLDYADGLMEEQVDRLRSRGNNTDADNLNKWGGMISGNLQGSAQGAAIGMVGGPWGALIGAAIGGTIGAITGFINGDKENEAAKKQREAEEKAAQNLERREKLNNWLSLRGLSLNHEYTDEEIEMISNGRSAISASLEHNMNIYDPGVLSVLPNKLKLANGGLLIGPSHAQGGITLNDRIEAEGGEFIVNAASTANNLGLLNEINNNKITPLQPMGEQLSVIDDYNGQQKKMQHDFGPLNGNLGGEIVLRLDGNSANIDVRELMNNPIFINQMRDKLMLEMNMVTDKSFNKNNYYRKW